MERLTIRTPTGAALKMNDHYPNEDAARHDLMEKYKVAMEKLAAYEDISLGPSTLSELLDAVCDWHEAYEEDRLFILPPLETGGKEEMTPHEAAARLGRLLNSTKQAQTAMTSVGPDEELDEQTQAVLDAMEKDIDALLLGIEALQQSEKEEERRSDDGKAL